MVHSKKGELSRKLNFQVRRPFLLSTMHILLLYKSLAIKILC